MFTLHNGDCHKFQPPAFDLIVTDPPYPNVYQDEYGYFDGIIDFLDDYSCRQFVFWTVTEPFPLSFTAKHTWDKITGTYARYEYIYERNGDTKEYEFKYQKYNNFIDAQFYRDVKTDHPSQKNVAHIKKLLSLFSKEGDVIYDPFMGSGTVGVAALQLQRLFVGVERKAEYFAIAEKRIKSAALQPGLFTPSNNRLHLTGGTVPANRVLSTPEDLPSEG
jgi:DNA modification methylase